MSEISHAVVTGKFGFIIKNPTVSAAEFTDAYRANHKVSLMSYLTDGGRRLVATGTVRAIGCVDDVLSGIRKSVLDSGVVSGLVNVVIHTATDGEHRFILKIEDGFFRRVEHAEAAHIIKSY